MQHKEWQDLIPFYVAQSLSSDDMRRFEQHLASCASCQQDIDDWRIIASAVWRQADSVARDLPPLSQEVYNRLNYRDRAPQSRYSSNPPQRKESASLVRPMKQSRRFAMPFTLVAGIVVAVLFGGLLMLIALRPPQNDVEIALNMTDISANSDTAAANNGLVDATRTPLPTTQGLGIIPTLAPEIQPTMTNGAPVFFTNTPQSPPLNPPAIAESSATNQTPLIAPPTISNGDSDVSAVSAAVIADITRTPIPAPLGGGPYITVTPNTFAEGLPLCEAFNPTGVPIEVYSRADRNSEIVGILIPDTTLLVTAQSTTGWYLLRLVDGSQGWLQSGFAYLRGNCSGVIPIATIVPTATRTRVPPTPVADIQSATLDSIVVINAAFADLYQAPTFNSEIVGVAARNQQFPVIGYQGTGTNRWVLVQASIDTQAWLWASTVTEYPADAVPSTPSP